VDNDIALSSFAVQNVDFRKLCMRESCSYSRPDRSAFSWKGRDCFWQINVTSIFAKIPVNTHSLRAKSPRLHYGLSGPPFDYLFFSHLTKATIRRCKSTRHTARGEREWAWRRQLAASQIGDRAAGG